MPVPRITDERVRATPLPSARVTPSADAETFGGGASAERLQAATTDVLGTAQKAIIQQRNNADDIAVQDSDLKASQLQTGLQVGASQMRGKNAAGSVDYVTNGWNHGVADIEKGLNDRQKALLRPKLNARFESLNRYTQVHTSEQLQAYDTESTNSYVENARNEGVLKYANPDDVDLSMYQQQGAIISYAKRNGLSDEKVKELLTESRTKTISGVIQKAITDGNVPLAKQYYEKGKDYLTGNDVTQVGNAVKNASLIYDAQQITNQISEKGLSAEKVYEEVKKIDDPALRQAVLKNVTAEYRAQENLAKLEKQASKKQYDTTVYTLADKLVKKQLTKEEIDRMVTAGEVLPDDALPFKIAISSPQEWDAIKSDPKRQAQGGRFYVDVINKLDNGADISQILTNAVKQYNNGELDQTDLAWIMRAASMKNNPAEKSIWERFVSTVPAMMRNFGMAGAFSVMRGWNFQMDPIQYYKQYLQTAVSQKVGIDTPPKYLVNAYGFLKQLFDGEQQTEQRPRKNENAKSDTSDSGSDEAESDAE